TLWVQAGETRLRQIISNLLSNALDALVERPPVRRIWLRAERQGEGVLLTLRDNGPGFSDEAM
ncbi:MAG TPA: sensor histidine kinase, partial [Pseudomonas sp.]|nr:sensor histidine kinase [Pseudomonas sp.]